MQKRGFLSGIKGRNGHLLSSKLAFRKNPLHRYPAERAERDYKAATNPLHGRYPSAPRCASYRVSMRCLVSGSDWVESENGNEQLK
jgi:hypothetical protein